MTKPKTSAEWKAALLKDWPQRAILTALTAFAGYAWSQGGELVREKVIEIVKPSIDTLSQKQEATDKKVERVDKKVDALISLMVDAFPQVKKAAAEQALRDSTNQAVKNALAGGNP